MSRRPPNPAAERAAQNQVTIKSLLKLESNKVCADCKRNKHPRWASWNLGVFVCIRCSGIHRGMGTHISRVKSVDLDSWNDEQMQSILRWGNARANKYWEDKLSIGHAPSESKIENFIRTKYELKRWVMDGPMPDPSTLDGAGDDDVPLSVVKKQAIERQESTRRSLPGQQQANRSIPPPQVDLIGGDDGVPARASTGGPSAKATSSAEAPLPKPTNTKDSLLGLDFLGESSAPPRPASTSGVSATGGQSRPDLKQSILSLYASAPRPQPQPQGSFANVASPPAFQQQRGSVGGFNDAFSDLSMSGSSASVPPPVADPFAGLGGSSSSSRRPAPAPRDSSFSNLSGGSFFDKKPAQVSSPPQQSKPSAPSGFGAFGGLSSPSPSPAATYSNANAQTSQSAMGDLFDLSSPVTQSAVPVAAPPQPTPPAAYNSSAFNLSSHQIKSTSPAKATTTTVPGSGSGLSGADVWGGNEWNTPMTATTAAPQTQQSPGMAKPTTDFGWGSSGALSSTPIVPSAGGGLTTAPKVAVDEEFGGWASSTVASKKSEGQKSSGGFGGDDDLFSNVWS